MITKTRATLEGLYATAGKAELVNRELRLMGPTGGVPGFAGDEIFVSLHQYVRMTRFGCAVGDNKGFLSHLPNRKSFSQTDLSDADLRGSAFDACDFTDAIMKGVKLTYEQGSLLNLSESQRQEIDWQDDDGEEPEGG